MIARLLRRVTFEGLLLVAAFALGMFAWMFVASIEEATWDSYMTAHGGMSPTPEFVQAHKLGPHMMPLLLLTPPVFVLLVRLFLWSRRRLTPA